MTQGQQEVQGFFFNLVSGGVSLKRSTDCPYTIPTHDSIMKLINSAAYRVDRNKLLSDIFECGAIAISNKFDLHNAEEREKRYLQIIKSYQQRERELIAEIFGNVFALLSSVTYDDGRFNDWLGKLFMDSSAGNSKSGQFFTPYHVSHLMAEIALEKEVVEEKKQSDGILEIYEPCCGSGGMMMASLDVLKNKYDFNYAMNCFIVAEDIDLRCVHMCYLQLSLAGVPGIIKHQNSLSREKWSVWKTPAFILQYLRFRKYEKYN